MEEEIRTRQRDASRNKVTNHLKADKPGAKDGGGKGVESSQSKYLEEGVNRSECKGRAQLTGVIWQE